MHILAGFLTLAIAIACKVRTEDSVSIQRDTAANSASDYGFFKFSPTPETIGGLDYPRNGLLQYRGTTVAQLSVDRALRAMLGDESVYLESFFFTTIKLSLMGQAFGLRYH